MKIYPSKHKITQVSSVNLDLDIPLAYMDSDFKDYNIDIIPQFITDRKDKVIPYNSYSSLDVCLFDSANNLVDNTSILQRDNGKYYYVPQKCTTFSPQRFNYSVVGKKHMAYSSNRNYNLKVACVDDDTLTFSKTLIKVFGDAPDRDLCPKNITVNNKDLSVQSLTNSSIQENDFLFIQSPDGLTYSSGATIDLQGILSKHTNIILSVTNFPYTLTDKSTLNSEEITGISNPILYSDIPVPSKVFNIASIFAEAGITKHNIFNSLNYSGTLILEYDKKGFVVMVPQDFVTNLETNVKLLYEVMMYVYLKSYLESDPINEWITDYVPDYVVLNNKLVPKEKFTSDMEIHKIFGLETDDISLIDIIIDKSNISFVGISNNYIVFKKSFTNADSIYADPVKPSNSISIFTPRQTVIYYSDYIYEIEESLVNKISCTRTDYALGINIKPFKNSLKAINVSQESYLTYSLTSTVDGKQIRIAAVDICIVCKENILNLVDKKTYTELDGIIIAEVQVSLTKDVTKIYDMRQRGGGLPEDETPSTYSLMDIGSIYGMAYRKAGTMIITLPKRLEKYEELIEKVVKKHMIGEELPIILFEDKEV